MLLRSTALVAVFALVLLAAPSATSASGPTVPDAPTITGITVGSNSVSVAFSPNSDGGDAITAYTVTCDSSDGGVSQAVTGADTPISVGSLSNGNTYSCVVVATNSIGDSAASDPSDDFTAITVPDAPTITGLMRGSNSAIVSFDANGDGGDDILFYKVTCVSSTGGTTKSKTGVSSPITVTSLSNGRTYTCTVVATNTVGDSAASAASSSFVAATTPGTPAISGVTRGDNAAIVAVSPGTTGGTPITSYTATCTSSDGGITETASNGASPVTVDELSNGNTYTCTAKVTNSFGDSPSSAASSSFVVAAVPDAPTLTTLDRGLNSATVGFTANGDGGDGITGFTATCTSGDGGTTESNSGATSPITVSSLTNSKTYTCNVVATNTVGDSAASTSSSSFVAATVPDAPTISGVTRGDNSAIVAVTPNSDGGDPITGYTATCMSS
ncbi:MAG TPA: fibronectin type III domain-containing protein, partial [Acidimicrobiia bacterium]|nr:fibronectin type III domain-containing protein [Acidimicrobiia bacterium]